MAAVSIELTSPAFENGGPIPVRYTGDGEDISPPLQWSGVPKGAKELVILCEDPRAASDQPWTHWILYKVSAKIAQLPEGIEKKEHPRFPPGAVQGKNSWRHGQIVGYRGPAPPPGDRVHKYHYKIYALDAIMTTEPEITAQGLVNEVMRHIIGYGELVGTYVRERPARSPKARAQLNTASGGSSSLSRIWQKLFSS